MDGLTTAANFSVTIDDPCKTAVFQTSPAPLTTMAVNMPSSATSTQTVVIKTDVELAHPTIVCPFTATNLIPAAAFISLSANIISVNASLISSPGDFGTHSFTLTAISSNFSGAVATQAYSFDVVIDCSVTSLTFITAPPVSTTLQVGIDLQPSNIAFEITQTPACGKSVNFALSSAQSFLSLQNLTSSAGNVQINAATIADHGVYAKTLTATVDA